MLRFKFFKRCFGISLLHIIAFCTLNYPSIYFFISAFTFICIFYFAYIYSERKPISFDIEQMKIKSDQYIKEKRDAQSKMQ